MVCVFVVVVGERKKKVTEQVRCLEVKKRKKKKKTVDEEASNQANEQQGEREGEDTMKRKIILFKKKRARWKGNQEFDHIFIFLCIIIIIMSLLLSVSWWAFNEWFFDEKKGFGVGFLGGCEKGLLLLFVKGDCDERGEKQKKGGESAERLSTDGEVGGGLVWLSGLDGDVVGLHVVEADEDEGSAETTEDVGTGTLEEGVDTVVLEDLGSAVEGSRVLGLGGTRGHHHAATDGVEGVGDETSDDGDGVTEGEAGEEAGVLAHEVHLVGGIVDAKVSTTVEDDTDAGDDEAVVDSTLTPSLGAGGLEDAVKGSGELALGSVSDIDGETGTGKVEGVDDEERGGSGGTTRGDVGEEADEETIRAGATEPLSVEVLEHKVKGLGGEVADDVGHVSTPERNPSLLLGNTTEAVDDTSVGLGDLGRLSLVLEEELDALDGGSDGLGDTGGNTSEHKVFEHVGG